MAFKRAHSDSGIYFISGAHFSLNEKRELRLLDEEVRGYFQHKLKGYAQFCGVELISYSLLPDHFYLLVQVSLPETLSDDALIERLKCIYTPDRVDLERDLLTEAREEGDDVKADALRKRFLHRMWDISTFMKELQLHMTKWFNRIHNRRGKFWESQFRSSVVKDDLYEIGVIASFIELASVREKLVRHPKAYPFATYGAALGGDEVAQKAVCRVLAVGHLSWKQAANRFLHWLYLCCGNEAQGMDADIKRYAHDIKEALFETRSPDREWSRFRTVQQGDHDHPVLKGILTFSVEMLTSIPTDASFRLSPKMPSEPEEPRLWEMKVADFSERAG